MPAALTPPACRAVPEKLKDMSKYESGIKQIPHPQETVYNTLSDLNNIERVKDRIPADKIQGLTFDHDTVSISVPPVGSITLKIIEREEPKCIKFETENSPVPFNLWVQLLPVTETTCKMKVTRDGDHMQDESDGEGRHSAVPEAHARQQTARRRRQNSRRTGNAAVLI